jgi:16S rRNA (guanine527-N7)-methyltransferase
MASDAASRVLAPYREIVPAPQEIAEDLDRFAALLARWNAAHNLVSRETTDALWERHIADSLQLLPLLQEADASIVDLGSGGGFPALPLAIAGKSTGRRFTLVEASAKKAAFLRAVIRDLTLPASVEQRRIETLERPETAPDVVTSRALAPLPQLLPLAFPLFGARTRGLFHKGREHGEELRQGGLDWRFDVLLHPSVTGGGGVILELRNLQPRDGRPEAENRR